RRLEIEAVPCEQALHDDEVMRFVRRGGLYRAVVREEREERHEDDRGDVPRGGAIAEIRDDVPETLERVEGPESDEREVDRAEDGLAWLERARVREEHERHGAVDRGVTDEEVAAALGWQQSRDQERGERGDEERERQVAADDRRRDIV